MINASIVGLSCTDDIPQAEFVRMYEDFEDANSMTQVAKAIYEHPSNRSYDMLVAVLHKEQRLVFLCGGGIR